MPQIAVRLSDAELEELDRNVTEGRFPTRAEALRAALRALRDQQIAESYRRAYAEHPQDERDPWLDAAAAETFRST